VVILLCGLSMGPPPYRTCGKVLWPRTRMVRGTISKLQARTSIGFDRDLCVTVSDHLLFEVSSIEARLLDLFFLRSHLTESVRDIYTSCMNASSTDRSAPPALRGIMSGCSHFDVQQHVGILGNQKVSLRFGIFIITANW